jgi:lysophospholipase L1-like esterase
VDANGEGATLPEFATYGATQAVISAVIMCRSNAPDLVIRVKDTAGFIHAEWPVPKETQRVATKYQFPAKLPASTKKAKIEIVAKAGVTGSVAVIVDQVDVFAVTGATDRPVIEPDRRAVVVALGDSWIAGDLASTAEREPMTKQLVKELPLCRVINAGVGGNKVQDLLDRFDTDVVPHKPDYVVINTGTNDAYNPASGVFFPNSVDFFEYTYSQLLHKVMEIGARPIILGVPGLAEEDGTKVNWELNDRAKTYNRYFQKRISAVPEYVPEQAASLTAWTPILKIGGVSTGITYARQSGFYERRGPWVHFTLDLEMTAKGVETGAVTVGGFPIAAKSGVIVPVATTAINVAGSAAMQGVLNIGEANEIRLQIQPSTGSAAADETNITDNTRLIMAGKYPAFDA